MNLDLTSVVKGEPLRVMQSFPNDKLLTREPYWQLHADISDEVLQESARDLLDDGYTQDGVDEVHRQRGWYVYVVPPVVTGVPCAWGPHIRHLDMDGNCTSCALEAPTARQQFTGAIGAELTRADAEQRRYVLYKGRNCPHGHDGWRFVATDRCWECFDAPEGVKKGQYTAAQQFADGVPVDFSEAHASGFYLYLGRPCKDGHAGWRRVKGRACYECAIGRDAVPPPKDMSQEMAKAFGYAVFWAGESGWQRVSA